MFRGVSFGALFCDRKVSHRQPKKLESQNVVNNVSVSVP